MFPDNYKLFDLRAFWFTQKDGLSNKALFTFSDESTVDVKPQLQKESMNFIYTNIQSSYLTAGTNMSS